MQTSVAMVAVVLCCTKAVPSWDIPHDVLVSVQAATGPYVDTHPRRIPIGRILPGPHDNIRFGRPMRRRDRHAITLSIVLLAAERPYRFDECFLTATVSC
jgi:hypothetical protein